MLAQRLLTTAIGAPVVLAIVVIGGVPYFLTLGFAAAFASHELYSMLSRAGHRPHRWLMLALSAALPLSAPLGVPHLDLFIVVAVLAASLIVSVARGDVAGPPNWTLSIGGALLTGGMLYFLALLRLEVNGLWWVLAILLGTWASDTAAYAVGRLAGRRKLAPAVSPGKTVEGLIGSVLLTPVALVGLRDLAPLIGLSSPLPPLLAAVLGLLIALASAAGDLSESLVKRQCGVKDSGSFLPGHGGLLDRIDGLLFAGVAGFGLALVVR